MDALLKENSARKYMKNKGNYLDFLKSIKEMPKASVTLEIFT